MVRGNNQAGADAGGGPAELRGNPHAHRQIFTCVCLRPWGWCYKTSTRFHSSRPLARRSLRNIERKFGVFSQSWSVDLAPPPYYL